VSEEHFLKLNTNALEKLEEVFLKDLLVIFRCHCIGEENWTNNSCSRSSAPQCAFCGVIALHECGIYLNTLLVNVTTEAKMVFICKPNVLKNCRISLQ
jgi:hypothetical protein